MLKKTKRNIKMLTSLLIFILLGLVSCHKSVTSEVPVSAVTDHPIVEAVMPDNYNDTNAGTESNPYIINSLGNLKWLSENPTYWGEGTGNGGFEVPITTTKFYFKQTNHIDATETKHWNAGRGFMPIGIISDQEEKLFWGDYDGGGFTISNLFIDYQEDNIHFIGFFGAIANTKISNLKIDNITILASKMTGVLAGLCTFSEIYNSSTSGVIFTGNHFDIIGGLISVAHNSNIDKAYSTILVSGQKKIKVGAIGGLIGTLSHSNLTNSFFKGAFKDISSHSGGLTSVSSESTISYTYTYIKDEPKNYVSLSYLINDTALTHNVWITDDRKKIKPFFQENGECHIEHNNQIDIKSRHNIDSYLDWDFSTIWAIDPQKNDGFPFLR